MTANSELTYQDFINQWLDPNLDAIEAQTSGSTGEPKQILLSKSLMRASAARTIHYFGIDSDWMLGSCISPRYIGGKMVAVRALEAKSEFFYLTPSNRPDLTFALSSGKNTLVSVVPSQLWHILSLPLTETEKSKLHLLVGGSAIPSELRQLVAEKGFKAWESYGMTETASHVAIRRMSDKDLPFSPLPGIDLSVSKQGTLVIENWGGEGALITNDLVEMTPNGSFRIIGRADNVIVTGGLKVNPEQLEGKIRHILRSELSELHFSDLMISSRPDPKWNEAIILRIEIPQPIDDGAHSTLLKHPLHDLPKDANSIMKVEKLLKTHTRHHTGEKPIQATNSSISEEKIGLLPHEVPKEIEFVTSLPRTANGKLRRK